MSTTRFDNPEVSSEPLTVNLALGFGGRTELVIDEKNIGDDDSGTQAIAFAQGSITAAKGLEISVRGNDESATRVGIKYQFYGAHTEQAVTGDISQAFTLGFEKNTTSSAGNYYQSCESFSCEPVYDYGSWEHDTNVYDIAWIIGYRLTERNILYGGPFYQWGQLKGYKTTFNNASLPLKSDGDMIGTNIAIEHRFSFGLGLAGEVVYSKLNWGNFSETDTTLNFKIDYQF